MEGERFRVFGETQASGDPLEDEDREDQAGLPKHPYRGTGSPVFRGDTVTADIKVTRAVPSGLLGKAVEMLDDLLELQYKITELIQ